MELRQLRYFVSVADELNFTRAAKKLHVAQPALSRQIRQLEEEIGVTLFDRCPGGVRCTKAGEVFLGEARALLAKSNAAVRAAQRTRGDEFASLNIGYAWGLFHSLVPHAVARFRRKYRETEVNLFDMTAPQQTAALIEGRIDAGFIGFDRDAGAPALARRKIGACAFLAALPETHAAAKKGVVELSTLAKEFFCVISDENFPGAAHCAIEACASAGFRPKVLQTAARGITMLGLVAVNRGVALMPEPLAALPHPGVAFRPLTDPHTSDLFVVWNPGRPSEIRDALLDLLAPESAAKTEGLKDNSH